MATWTRLDAGELERLSGHALFQSVVDHVAEQLGGYRSYKSARALVGIPDSVLTTWYLWFFASEVAGNGLADFLVNQCQSQEEIECFHAALRAVGAEELKEMLEEAVPLAMEEESSLRQNAIPGFRLSGKTKGQWRELWSLENESMRLAAEPLSIIVANFVKRAHSKGEI